MRSATYSTLWPMTETLEVTLREPTPRRIEAVAFELNVSVEDLQNGDVPDDPLPSQVERVLAIVCEDHERFAPREWSRGRRDAVMGGILAQFLVGYVMDYNG